MSIVLHRRAELGLTQAELAARAAVSRKTIVRAERGAPMTAVVAGKLAAALGVDVAVLLPPTEDRAA